MNRVVALIFALLVGIGTSRAQQGEVTLGIRGGGSTLYGAFSAFAVEAEYSAKEYFALRGGVQYSTISRVTTEVRPAYFHDFNVGRLSAELLLNYAYQSRVSNYAFGCGLLLDTKYISAALGYYCRVMTIAADRLFEPFNIYYKLAVHCLPNRERWDLKVIFSNSQALELERHYQPSLAVEGWYYPLERLGVQLGVNYKPAGMFNLSSDYYQIYGNVGVCYRW